MLLRAYARTFSTPQNTLTLPHGQDAKQREREIVGLQISRRESQWGICKGTTVAQNVGHTPTIVASSAGDSPRHPTRL